MTSAINNGKNLGEKNHQLLSIFSGKLTCLDKVISAGKSSIALSSTTYANYPGSCDSLFMIDKVSE